MRNPENNYRSYTKEQIIILCMVRRLRSMECSLEEIRYRENILHNSNEFIDRLRTA